jgi:hypothetical protein
MGFSPRTIVRSMPTIFLAALITILVYTSCHVLLHLGAIDEEYASSLVVFA